MEHVQNNNARAKQSESEKSRCSHTETQLGVGADDGDNFVGGGRRNLDMGSDKLNCHNPLQTLCHPTKWKGPE